MMAGVGGFGMGQAGGAGSVLLVNNLPAEDSKCSVDTLFTLFGVYGDVVRVKILFSKRGTALVQMAAPHQAQLALMYLHKLAFYGKELIITVSKFPEIQMPRDSDKDSAGLTKDYHNSPIHRFRGRPAKNIFAPSQVLHLSNMPADASESELRKLFGRHAFLPPACSLLQS